MRRLAVASTVAMSAVALAATASTQKSVTNPSAVQPQRASLAAATLNRVALSSRKCEKRFQGSLCLEPNDIRNLYDLGPLYRQGFTGKGETIAIVDSFGSPTIREDLHRFDAAYGLPDPTLQIIQPVGPVHFNPHSSDQVGWATETTMDVEWAHAVAPEAKIVLAETPVSETEGVHGFPQMVQAENYIVDHNLGDVISQSFGATELTFPHGLQTINSHHLRSAYQNAYQHKVTVLAASGDFGSTDALTNGNCCYTQPVTDWPASDPLVTAVGGTEVFPGSNGQRAIPDKVWNDGPDQGAGGGGLSQFFPRPAWQDGVAGIVGNHRGVPDISMDAAGSSPVVIYYSFTGTPQWGLEAGTSLATPMMAGVVALADQVAGHRLGLINPALYRLADKNGSGEVDVTAGDNTYSFSGADGRMHTVPGFAAGPGYDLASGWGTVDANLFVRNLARNAGRSLG